MFYFSQKDSRWANETIGTSKEKIIYQGCYITSLGMMRYLKPSEINAILTKQKAYDKDCLVNAERAAKALGLQYDGKVLVKPKFICICDTYDYDRPSTAYKEQHFFVFAPKGTFSEIGDFILDPLDNPKTMSWKQNKYKIASYRLFHEMKPDTEYEDAWTAMMKQNIYTQFTKKNDIVTTDMLAVFLNRFKK